MLCVIEMGAGITFEAPTHTDRGRLFLFYSTGGTVYQNPRCTQKNIHPSDYSLIG